MASTTSTPGSAPKAMSSRLLTMKFMQRAAASPTSPSPVVPDERPQKRRKKDADPSAVAFDVNALANNLAVQKALGEEEAIRQAALDRQAAEAGDTRWVLNFEDEKRPLKTYTTTLQVVPTGFANLDSLSAPQIQSLSEEDVHDRPLLVGRRSFGKFNRILERQQNPSLDDSSDSTSENEDEDAKDFSANSDDSSSDSNNPTDALLRASQAEAAQRLKSERKAKKKAEKKKGEKLAKQRKKKEVNINGLSSLSGEKAFSPTKGPCYNCDGPHLRADCPETKRVYQGGIDDSRPRKSLRKR